MQAELEKDKEALLVIIAAHTSGQKVIIAWTSFFCS